MRPALQSFVTGNRSATTSGPGSIRPPPRDRHTSVLHVVGQQVDFALLPANIEIYSSILSGLALGD